jgi:hypothetical protein
MALWRVGGLGSRVNNMDGYPACRFRALILDIFLSMAWLRLLPERPRNDISTRNAVRRVLHYESAPLDFAFMPEQGCFRLVCYPLETGVAGVMTLRNGAIGDMR